MTPSTEDTPAPRRRGWDEYQLLVLGKLEDLGSHMQRLDADLRRQALDVELMKARTAAADDHERRIQRLEAANEAEVAIDTYRRWLIGLSVVVILSIIAPIVRALLSATGGA